jgi:nitrogenase molybdenum-iron protein alpha/beta subunit
VNIRAQGTSRFQNSPKRIKTRGILSAYEDDIEKKMCIYASPRSYSLSTKMMEELKVLAGGAAQASSKRGWFCHLMDIAVGECMIFRPPNERNGQASSKFIVQALVTMASLPRHSLLPKAMTFTLLVLQSYP